MKLEQIRQYSNNTLFNTMPKNLLKNCHIIKLKKNDIIFREGDKIRKVYYLLKGNIKIIKKYQNGQSIQINLLEETQVLGGIIALNEYTSYKFDAICDSDSVLIYFSKKTFYEWLDTDLNFAKELARTSASLMLQNLSIIMSKSVNTSDYSVVKFIIDYCNFEKEYTTIKETRLQISNILGISERTLNRILAKLKARGLIQIEKGKITVQTKKQEELNSYLKTISEI